ncbi:MULTISPECIES: hypothetical protein [unclassified Mesotoga]|uniref:hypothetical protein n=1 Tax=unclassified Mesotoga TaxID=1184398 RepID=UPI000DA6BBA2|nr:MULTISPECIES: hypothetical protein [unclassified Mesotoga]PZC52724.1 hypothetical protein LH53_03120 [Mesotoga sp. TolDC]
MQAITAKRKSLVREGDKALTSSDVWGLFGFLQVLVIFLSLAVSIALPFYFGNEVDKITEVASRREQDIMVMKSRLEDVSREISYLQTVVGARAEK